MDILLSRLLDFVSGAGVAVAVVALIGYWRIQTGRSQDIGGLPANGCAPRAPAGHVRLSTVDDSFSIGAHGDPAACWVTKGVQSRECVECSGTMISWVQFVPLTVGREPAPILEFVYCRDCGRTMDVV